MPCSREQPLPKPIQLPGGQGKSVFSITCPQTLTHTRTAPAPGSQPASRPAGSCDAPHDEQQGDHAAGEDAGRSVSASAEGGHSSAAGAAESASAPCHSPARDDSSGALLSEAQPAHGDGSSAKLRTELSEASELDGSPQPHLDAEALQTASDGDSGDLSACKEPASSHEGPSHEAKTDASSVAGSVSGISTSTLGGRSRGKRGAGDSAHNLQFATTSLDRSVRFWRVPVRKYDIAWKSGSVRRHIHDGRYPSSGHSIA